VSGAAADAGTTLAAVLSRALGLPPLDPARAARVAAIVRAQLEHGGGMPAERLRDAEPAGSFDPGWTP
jgi:hypothetical protein